MKRHAKKIVLFLVLGAIINVLLAWDFAVLVNPYEQKLGGNLASNASDGLPSHYVLRLGGNGSDAFFVYSSRGMDVSKTPNVPSLREYLPIWADTDGIDIRNVYIFDARGWPTRSIFSAMELPHGPSQNTFLVRDGWEAPLIPIMNGWQVIPRVLPVHPIWPGFAINTIFYAAILWLLFAVPFAVRRRRRIKRGLCPACAYPVGTNDVCTECGKAIGKR